MLKKVCVVGIIFLFVVVGFRYNVNVFGETLDKNSDDEYDFYVDDDANESWYDERHLDSIFSAVILADYSGTIFVYNGTYEENMIIEANNITIIGENRDNTTIIYNRSKPLGDRGTPIYVGGESFNLYNFTIETNEGNDDSTETYGIKLIYRENLDFDIKCININNFQYGIYIYKAEHCDVTGNNISNCLYGISIVGSSNCDVTGNNIGNCKDGIVIHSSANCDISRNNISYCYYGIRCVLSSHNTISWNNICFEHPILSSSSGIYLLESISNDILHNDINDLNTGIFLERTDHNTLYYNVIYDNTIGIKLSVDRKSSIAFNKIYNNNNDGVCISYPWDIKDTNDLIVIIRYYGIYELLRFSEELIIYDNEIWNNSCGINLTTTRESYIGGNKITNNTIGISLFNSFRNHITDNDIYENNMINMDMSNSAFNSIMYNNLNKSHIGVNMRNTADNVLRKNNITDNNNYQIILRYCIGDIFNYNNIYYKGPGPPGTSLYSTRLFSFTNATHNFWDTTRPRNALEPYWSPILVHSFYSSEIEWWND